VHMPCEPPLRGDSAIPRLGDALDAGAMMAKFREHLQPAGKVACEILARPLSRIRHREAERSILQYTLHLSKPGWQKRKVDR
jgi:hypothetical protein